MRVDNTYGLGTQHVLTGLFKKGKDVFHAQEILTDFGYPKEASSMVELKDRSQRAKAYGKQIVVRIKDKLVLGISIGAVLVLGALMAGGHFYSTLNFSEMAIFLTVWVSIVVIGAAVCGFIGILVAMLIGSTLAEEVTGRNDVLISVAIRTPNDAKDIAREWKEIGGMLV
jgi:hypothetical protein